MSLPIILSGSGVDLKGDANGSAQVSLLDSSGNPIRKTVRSSAFEIGVNPFDYTDYIGQILDVGPAVDSSYTTSSVPLTVDGYDVVTFLIQAAGTGTRAFKVGVEVSMDNSTWHRIHNFYFVGPQGDVTTKGVLEFRTAFKYARLVMATEDSTRGVPTNINVVAARSLKSLAMGAVHSISINTFGAGFDETYPHSRGLYVVEYVIQANTTANYVYIALFNPATSKAAVRLLNMSLVTQNTSNNGVGTLRALNMVAIASVTGGTPATPSYFRSTQPMPFATMYSGNPTVTAGPVIYSFTMAAGSYDTFEQQKEFALGRDPILNPGEGWALIPSVALTTNDRIALRATFAEFA